MNVDVFAVHFKELADVSDAGGRRDGFEVLIHTRQLPRSAVARLGRSTGPMS